MKWTFLLCLFLAGCGAERIAAPIHRAADNLRPGGPPEARARSDGDFYSGPSWLKSHNGVKRAVIYMPEGDSIEFHPHGAQVVTDHKDAGLGSIGFSAFWDEPYWFIEVQRTIDDRDEFVNLRLHR